MSRNARVVLISSGMKQLLNDPGAMNAALRPSAELTLTDAVANAPVDTGEYRASLHIEVARTDRFVLRVVADAPHAFLVEANTGNLARASGAA